MWRSTLEWEVCISWRPVGVTGIALCDITRSKTREGYSPRSIVCLLYLGTTYLRALYPVYVALNDSMTVNNVFGL
jgi:hypothetical protein